MAPFVLFLVGFAVLGGGLLLLASFGERFRIARLIQSTPAVTIAQATQLALTARETGTAAPYIRTTGRIDSDDAFPDEHRRPLVFRRTRLQVREPERLVARVLHRAGIRGRPDAGMVGGWRTIEDQRERVDFRIVDGMQEIGIRDADLGDGLVVLPREAAGRAEEIEGQLPRDIPPSAVVRLRVEQISAVEHATVLGAPVVEEDGRIVLTPGGPERPLIVTPLEDAEAMRILAGDAPRRPLAIALLLISGLGLLALGTAWLALRVVNLA